MIASFLLGIAYGFAAGISPGPTLGLTITETLRRGWRAGSLIALAPLFTDLPIILLAVLLVGMLPPSALGWLALVGAAYVGYLGVETIIGVVKGEVAPDTATTNTASQDLGMVLRRGILTNAFNPHPYLFWGTAGAQTLVTILRDDGPIGMALFLIGFYFLLVGLKMLVAALVNRSRHLLKGNGYRLVIAASGVVLLGLALFLVYEGLGIIL